MCTGSWGEYHEDLALTVDFFLIFVIVFPASPFYFSEIRIPLHIYRKYTRMHFALTIIIAILLTSVVFYARNAIGQSTCYTS